MPITIFTGGDSLALPLSSVINQFSLVTNLVGITSNEGTNLERYKEILESNFDNRGVLLGETYVCGGSP